MKGPRARSHRRVVTPRCSWKWRISSVKIAAASRSRKIAAAVGCALAIATAIACRQQVAVTPLGEDPELAKTLANREQLTKQFEAARDMTAEQASTLEGRIALNPEDFDVRRQLVTYYKSSSKVAWATKVSGLRRHALWLIEHHPEHEVGAPALSPQFDPEGFAAAKKLWQAHLAKPGVSALLVYRAAMFFAPHDKPYAEQLILRGMAMDPDSAALKARMAADVGGYQRPSQLSSLYAAAVRGSESAWGTSNDLRTHLDRVNSPYAMQVRARLDAARDAQLLARVGSILARPESSNGDPAVKQALEHVRALGVRYLERALELDPSLDGAKAALVRLRLPGQATDVDRLANRAHEEHMVAEDITEYAKKDMAAGKRQREAAAEGRRARPRRGVPRSPGPLDDYQPRSPARGRAGDPRGTHAILVPNHGRARTLGPCVCVSAGRREGLRMALCSTRRALRVEPARALAVDV